MTPVRISQAVASGLSVVCATCPKYWAGIEAGWDRCTASTPCGSPLAGDDFREYVGPIRDLTRFCFVCGEASRYGVRPARRVRVIGVCRKHVTLLDRVAPVGLSGEVLYELLAVDGSLVTAAQAIGPRKKSLGAAIFEVEQFYADKYGYRNPLLQDPAPTELA